MRQGGRRALRRSGTGRGVFIISKPRRGLMRRGESPLSGEAAL
jgi:hypothetical protein